MADSGSTKLKLFGAAILFIGGIGFVYVQYKGNTAPAQPPRNERQRVSAAAGAPGAPVTPAAGPRRDGPPTEAERAQFRGEMQKELNITPEQQAKLDEINKKYEGKTGADTWQQRREEWDKILTPEQQAKGREAFMSRMKARMAERVKNLPEDEKAAYMAKLEERMKNGPPGGFGGRGPGGPGGPGGPPPPEAGAPK